MHPLQELEQILRHYDLGKLRAAKLLYKEWNVSYRIRTDTGTYVLKILHLGKRTFMKELYILNHLDARIPHVLPVETKEGKQYIAWRGTFACIFPFIKGRLVKNGSTLTSAELQELGRTLASIHRTRMKLAKKDIFRQIDRTLGKSENRHVRSALSQVKELRTAKLPSGFIHADLHTENIRVGNGITVFDFEEAYDGPFIYDLGLAFLDTCFVRGKLSRVRMAALVKGYERVRKLTRKERAFFRQAIIHAGLVSLSYNVIKNSPLKANPFFTRWRWMVNSKT